jgi:hypothetical protein
VFEAGVFEQRAVSFGVVHREDHAHKAGEIRADVIDDRLLHEFERRLNRSGRGDQNPASGCQDPMHLVKGGQSVLYEHEGHLTQHNVEVAVGEREGAGVALMPVDAGSGSDGQGRSHCDHVRGDVEARNRSTFADGLGRPTSDQSGAAANIEHALSGLEVGGTEKLGGHRDADGRDEVALVVLGAVAGELAVGDIHGRTIGASAACWARCSSSHPPLQ